MQRPKGYMDKEFAKNIIDQIARDKIGEIVHFHIMGEPTLHPNLVELIKYVEDKGLKADLITNGSMLTEQRVMEIMDAQPTRIDISLQTPSKESFTLRHGGIQYMDYINRIKEMLRYRIKNNTKTNIYVPIFTTHLNSIFALRDEFNIHGKKQLIVTLKEWYNWCKEVEEEEGKKLVNVEESEIDRISLLKGFDFEFLPGIHFTSRTLEPWANINTKGDKTYKALIGGCSAPKKQMAIYWDGRVTTCCKDYDGLNIIGNVKENTLKEILEGAEMKRVVSAFNKCQLPFDFCRVCRGGSNLRTWAVNQIGSIAQSKLNFNYGSQ